MTILHHKRLLNYFKLYIASILTIFLLLLSWKIGFSNGCYMLLLPIIFLITISYSFIELKMQERICIKQCYFAEQSFIAKMLSSRILVSIFYLIVSIMMSLSIIYGVIDYPLIFWSYLLFHIIFVILIFRYIKHLLRNIIKTKYVKIFAREWTINISSLVLILVSTYFTIYYGYIPDYLSESLLDTISNASSSMQSNCTITSYVIKAKIEIDSTFWWLLNKGTEQLDDHRVKIAIWIGFILINSLAILGLNRFMVQVIYMLDKIFNNEKNVLIKNV